MGGFPGTGEPAFSEPQLATKRGEETRSAPSALPSPPARGEGGEPASAWPHRRPKAGPSVHREHEPVRHEELNGAHEVLGHQWPGERFEVHSQPTDERLVPDRPGELDSLCCWRVVHPRDDKFGGA